jgi:hypothetical protein
MPLEMAVCPLDEEETFAFPLYETRDFLPSWSRVFG